jgi:hypothetical protein
MNEDLTRRSFLKRTGATVATWAAASTASPQRIADETQVTARPNRVHEIAWNSVVPYPDGYNDVDVDVTCTRPDGSVFTAPAFWDGGTTWRFRFAGGQPGEYRIESRSSRVDDAGLDAQRLVVRVEPGDGDTPLYRHGRLRVANDRRHFEHLDGTPFLWIGDTWWMGLTTRLDWPDGFRWLAADRAQKGFSVVQIIAGPYPDMDAWDPRGRNEAGFPFQDGFERVNPAYYQHADHKIGHLVESGLMPCIVGMWGYYLPQLGVEKVKRLWRYLIARYGAYPVTWCLCGEATMPYYLSQDREADAAAQKAGWTEVMDYVRTTDGYQNLVTIHPTRYGREQVEDPALMDFEMLQTGHGDIASVPNVIKSVRHSVEADPRMPIVNSEVNYEGIMGRSWQNVQRLDFYHTMMNGAAGFTYGANGIWQLNTEERPYGPSPHGRSWGSTPWRVAAQLPGSRQVGLGGRFFGQFPWWRLERHSEWIDEVENEHDAYAPVAAGIPGQLRIVYSPHCWNPPRVRGLEPDVAYTASWFDPVTGTESLIGPVEPADDHTWTPPFPSEVHDWLLVLRAG